MTCFQATNAATTTALTANVNAAVSVAATGITIRGNRSFRSSDSLATSDVIPSDVASEKKPNRTIPIKSETA